MIKIIISILTIILLSNCGSVSGTNLGTSTNTSLKSPKTGSLTYTDTPCSTPSGNKQDMNPLIPSLPGIQKQGYWGCVPESTPVVFNGQLLLVTYGAVNYSDGTQHRGVKVYDFMSRKLISFGEGASLFGSAFVNNGTLYYFTTTTPNIQLMSTTDLVNWTEPKTVLTIETPDQTVFNTSVTQGPDGFVMAYEVGGHDSQGDYGYTWRIAKSNDLVNWTTITDIYGREYTACPTIRYYNGVYTILYLGHADTGGLVTYAISTTDFVIYLSPKVVLAPGIGEGINTSDVDLVEYQGYTYIVYLDGNQAGWDDQMWAIYSGTEQEFFGSISN